MLSIHLDHLLFRSFHGLHEEEQVIGNDFQVNLTVQYQPASVPITTLDASINYVDLYELVKQRMNIPTPLLETIATEIATDILTQFSLAEQVSVSIYKLHPPISQFRGNVGISFELKRATHQ